MLNTSKKLLFIVCPLLFVGSLLLIFGYFHFRNITISSNVVVPVIGIITVAFLLILGIFYSVMNKKLNSSVNKLNRIAQQISNGDFDAKIESGNNEELADLADNINSMSQNIKKYVENAEINANKQAFIASLTKLEDI